MRIVILPEEDHCYKVLWCWDEIERNCIGSILVLFFSVLWKIYFEKMLIVFLIKESSLREISVLIRLQGRKEERRPPCYFQFLGWADVRRCRRRFVLETHDFSLFPSPFLFGTCQLDIAMCPRHRFYSKSPNLIVLVCHSCLDLWMYHFYFTIQASRNIVQACTKDLKSKSFLIISCPALLSYLFIAMSICVSNHPEANRQFLDPPLLLLLSTL